MFTASLLEYETRKNELQRQAAEFRLVKSLKESNPWIQNVFSTVGRLMIASGQQLVNRYQSTQSAHC